ncbi:MAG: lipoyl(octanoyl) transferase LipB [Pelagibacteraceae bacterium]|nr:lipoyl(octanoyl) transferase LipB [Pelagibacteraceae bacterium]
MTLEVKVSKKLVPYERAYRELVKRVDSIKKHKSKDLLWILEHPLTYTAGIRSNEKEVLDKTISLIRTNRGGKITLHNPGQKIIYFALNLNKRKKDIRNLVSNIENSIIEFLKIYKIKGYKDKKNIGIWVDKKKIAAIGIRVTQWIAYHGCSININNSLDPYKKIIPCGLDNKKITTVKKQIKIDIKNVEKNLKKIFVKNLKNI